MKASSPVRQLLIALAIIGTVAVTLYWHRAAATLELPDRPSLAVVPFVNAYRDERLDYFSDGVTDEVITSLSKFPSLFVVASNSSAVYKGRQDDWKTIGRELGVRYVLQGRVQRNGQRVVVDARLVDAFYGGRVWTERYDAPVTDLYALEDDIARKVSAAMYCVHSADLDKPRVPIDSTTAHGLLLRAKSELRAAARQIRGDRGSRVAEARRLLTNALAIDDDNAEVLSALAGADLFDWNDPSNNAYHDAATLARAVERSRRAIELKARLAEPYAHLAQALHLQGESTQALALLEKARQLNPNLADPRLGLVLIAAGRTDDAAGYLRGALRRDPFLRPTEPSLRAIGHVVHK